MVRRQGDLIISRNVLLADEDTVPKLRLPFIKYGYRRPCLSTRECLASVFKVHNETCNIWSHFIPFILIICMYLGYFSEHSIRDPLTWPLLSLASLSCYVFLISSFAHTFCVLSPNSVGLKGWSDSDMDDLFFSLDYAGISMLNFGFGQGYLFYTGISESTVNFHINLFFLALIIACNCATYVAIATSMNRENIQTFSRQIFFVVPYMLSVSPIIWRLCKDGIKCDEDLCIMFFSHIFMFFLGVSTFGFKIPERLAPGKFDILGQSHNWMHILTAVGAFQTHYLFMHILSTRCNLPRNKITLWNTFGLLVVCIVSNIAIVVITFCHFRNRKGENKM